MFVLFSALLVGNVRAASGINISSFPTSVVAGQEFEVGFSAAELDSNSNYNIKGLGGENFTEVDTWSGDWHQQNASWVSMPLFSSVDGSPSGTIKLRFDVNTGSGSKDLKLRIKKADSSDPNIDSNAVSISVSAVTPSPTPSPTPPQTPIPPTTTPSSTPIPTKKPTPKPTIEPVGKTLSIETSEPIPLPSYSPTSIPGPSPDQNPKFPVFAVILIILGLGFIGVAGFMAFKYNDNQCEKS